MYGHVQSDFFTACTLFNDRLSHIREACTAFLNYELKNFLMHIISVKGVFRFRKSISVLIRL